MAYVNQYRQMFPTQFDMPTIQHRGQAAVDAYNAGKADYENYAAHDAEMARAAYAGDQQRMAAQAAWQAQQAAAQKQGQATFAGIEALKQELTKNEAEIASLQAELQTLTAEVGDQDALDRALAANRARIGDMANSRAHQEDIKWRWQNKTTKDEDKNKALQKEAKDLAAQIEDAEIAMAMGGNAERPKWQAKIDRLKKELAENPYGAKYSSGTVKTSEAPSGYRSIDDIKNLINTYRIANKDNKTKKGGLTDAQKLDLSAKIHALPEDVFNTVEAHEVLKEIEDEKSIETLAAGASAQAKKDKATLDNFAQGKTYNDIDWLVRNKKELPKGVSISQDNDGYVVKVGKQKIKFAR